MDRYKEDIRGEKEEIPIYYFLFDKVCGRRYGRVYYGVDYIMTIRKQDVFFIGVVYGFIRNKETNK